MEDTHTLALRKLKVLISLAQIDGAIAAQETQYIMSIGKANGLEVREIEPLFERAHALVVPADLSEDERFNYLLSMVELMKADDKMFKEELLFCKKMAEHLGYDAQVLFEMLLHVRSSRMRDEEKEQLKQEVHKYLR